MTRFTQLSRKRVLKTAGLRVQPFCVGGFSGGAAVGDGGDMAFCDEFVDGLGVIGAVVTARVPLDQFGMIVMFGIGDGVEEVLEPGRTAAVFGRTAPGAVDVAWVFGVGLARPDGFYGDGVMPAVAHVIGVIELAGAAIDQRHELGVLRSSDIGPFAIRQTVAPFVDFELPEMVILPAHRRLDDVVHHLEAGLDGDIDDPPDSGLGVGQGDAQAGDSLGQAASLARSSDAFQFHGMSSSQRDAGQSAAILAMTSAMYACGSTWFILQVSMTV